MIFVFYYILVIMQPAYYPASISTQYPPVPSHYPSPSVSLPNNNIPVFEKPQKHSSLVLVFCGVLIRSCECFVRAWEQRVRKVEEILSAAVGILDERWICIVL